MAVEEPKTIVQKLSEVKKIEPWYQSFINKWSQKINSIVVLLPLAYASIPDKWQDALPDKWVLVLSGLGMASFIAVNLRQPRKE